MMTALPFAKDVEEGTTKVRTSTYGSFFGITDGPDMDSASEDMDPPGPKHWAHFVLIAVTIAGAVGYYELGDTVIVKCGCPVTVRFWGQSFQALFLGLGFVIMRCDAGEDDSAAEFDDHVEPDSLTMLLWRVAPWTAVDCISFFLAGVFMNLSFKLGTSAYTVTAMASLEPTFIHILEVVFVGKSSSFYKMSSLVVSGAGVLTFYVATKEATVGQDSGTLGLVCSMLMGIFWSISAVITEKLASEKYYYGANKKVGPILQQGLLGVFTIGLFSWTIFLETPPPPDQRLMFWIIIVEAGMTTFLYYISVAYVSAFYTSMSMILCIPINFVIDMMVRGVVPSTFNVLAGTMMLSGFLILQLSPNQHTSKYEIILDVEQSSDPEMTFDMDENVALLGPPPPPIRAARETSFSRVTIDSDPCDFKIDHFGA